MRWSMDHILFAHTYSLNLCLTEWHNLVVALVAMLRSDAVNACALVACALLMQTNVARCVKYPGILVLLSGASNVIDALCGFMKLVTHARRM